MFSGAPSAGSEATEAGVEHPLLRSEAGWQPYQGGEKAMKFSLPSPSLASVLLSPVRRAGMAQDRDARLLPECSDAARKAGRDAAQVQATGHWRRGEVLTFLQDRVVGNPHAPCPNRLIPPVKDQHVIVIEFSQFPDVE